jgi:hypothetical protein
MSILTRRGLLAATASPILFPFDIRGQQDTRDYDESKVRPYTLPNPLKFSDGQAVTSPSSWTTKRRPELLRLFETNMYGRAPGGPKKVRLELTSSDDRALHEKALRKLVTIRFSPDCRNQSKVGVPFASLYHCPREPPAVVRFQRP